MLFNIKDRSKFPSRRRMVSKGETLFCLNDKAETAYLVQEGVLIVCCSSPNGREVITSVYFPGEICAGISVLTGAEYLGTARAPKKSSTVVTPITRSEMADLLSEDSDIYRELILTQREKQKFKDRMLLGMVAESCQQRAAAALIWLYEKGAVNANSVAKSYLCRQELADLIGSTVETVIRVLSKFRKSGLIEEKNGTIKLDVPHLSELAHAS